MALDEARCSAPVDLGTPLFLRRRRASLFCRQPKYTPSGVTLPSASGFKPRLPDEAALAISLAHVPREGYQERRKVEAEQKRQALLDRQGMDDDFLDDE